jgi:hypothetical protein
MLNIAAVLHPAFDEHRYDALGKRVLLRARHEAAGHCYSTRRQVSPGAGAALRPTAECEEAIS